MAEELEAQIQAKNDAANFGASDHSRLGQTGMQPSSAPSPTALLDLLSSTATAQASVAPQAGGGLRSGAAESIMMMSGVRLSAHFTLLAADT